METRSSHRDSELCYSLTETMDGRTSVFSREKRRSALTHLLCGIYALVVIILGVAFPASAALTESDGGTSSIYLEVFHLYLYAVSLAVLAYIHCVLLRTRKPKKHDVTDINLVPSKELEDVQDQKGISENFVSTEPKEGETMSNHSKEEKANAPLRSRSRSPERIEMVAMIETTSPPVTFDAEGVNFYLRLGAILFGIGSMIHDGFKLASLFEDGTFSWQCRGPLYVTVAISHMVFVFFQTFFLFKSHEIIVCSQKAFVRFGFMHMVATNICLWLITTITETAEDIRQPNVSRTLTTDENNTGLPASVCDVSDSIGRRAAPYLFPCTVEYSLIAAAMLYMMYHNVGRVGRLAAEGSPTGQLHRRYTDCHKANKGLFLGLLVAILTLISVSCYFVFDGKGPNEPEDGSGYGFSGGRISALIFSATELVLLGLAAAVVLATFARFQQLRFIPPMKGEFNSALQISAFCGIGLFHCFLLIASIQSVSNHGLIAILAICSSGFALLQATIQIIFILDGLRRCADSHDHVHRKPGRALLTFLLLCNLSLWVLNTFEVDQADMIPMYGEFYGRPAWSVLSHLCIPLIIFYRFHSTVCLSDIWVNAYRLRPKE